MPLATPPEAMPTPLVAALVLVVVTVVPTTMLEVVSVVAQGSWDSAYANGAGTGGGGGSGSGSGGVH
jgi:hypothetical protein